MQDWIGKLTAPEMLRGSQSANMNISRTCRKQMRHLVLTLMSDQVKSLLRHGTSAANRTERNSMWALKSEY